MAWGGEVEMSGYGDDGDFRGREDLRSSGRARRGGDDSATERLERALQELKHSATDVVNEKAAGVVEDLERSVRRLREEMDEAPATGAGAAAEDGSGHDESRRGGGHRRSGRRRSRGIVDPDDWFDGRGRERSGAADDVKASRSNGWLRDLYREPERGWIAGVCAGFARYYDVDVWVARVVAFTLLLFVPQIAFWAYVIAIFMLGKRPRMDAPTPMRQAGSSQGSPAPEFGPRFAPRPGLRTLRVQFRDIELRLRQMEETVTSQEFTLKRELSALEADGPRTRGAT
jgi:phage shock protein C